jgi:hypothetical protein
VLVLPLFLAAPVPEGNPDVLALFADDPAYRAATAVESRYEGTLEFLPVPGNPGRYRLLVPEGDGKTQTYELHLPKPNADLGTFVGNSVRVTGKLTDKGLWPGKIERRTVAGGPGRDGVLARGFWQPPAAQRIKGPAQSFVLKSGEQVAGLLPLRGTNPARAASDLVAQSLRVPEIDWNKQMVVCVALGLRTDVERLTITQAVARDGVLTVTYRLQKFPAGMANGFGYPAETALVPKFDGTVRFQEEGAP